MWTGKDSVIFFLLGTPYKEFFASLCYILWFLCDWPVKVLAAKLVELKFCLYVQELNKASK